MNVSEHILSSWPSICSLTCFFHLQDLKRFSDSRTSKLSTYVNFPLKDLDMREFSAVSSGEYHSLPPPPHHTPPHDGWTLNDLMSSLPTERPMYNLYAVSNHTGNTLGGHYTAYCRNPALGEWYSYNDSRYRVSTSSSYFNVSSYQIGWNLAACTCCQMDSRL